MIAIDAPLPLDSEPPREEAALPPAGEGPLVAALVAALERISAAAADPDPARMIHQARKAMKEYRALLRLIPGPAARTARREMAATARTLAAARDHAAAIEALERLRDKSRISIGDFTAARALIGYDAPVDAHLATCRNTLLRLGEGSGLGADLAAAATAADLPAGLARTYRRARAGRFRSPKAMHALRKDVVIHRYQMSFIAAWFGGRGHRRAKRAQALRDLLGLHHDMEILDPMLAEVAGRLGAPATRRVRKAARRQQQDLRRKARRLHGKLFRRRPKAFARLWRDLTAVAPAGPEQAASADAVDRLADPAVTGREPMPPAPAGTADMERAGPADPVPAGQESTSPAPAAADTAETAPADPDAVSAELPAPLPASAPDREKAPSAPPVNRQARTPASRSPDRADGSGGRGRSVPSRVQPSAGGAVAQPVRLDLLYVPLMPARVVADAGTGSPWARSPEAAEAPLAATPPRHGSADAASDGPGLRKKDAAVQEVSAPGRFIESATCPMTPGTAAHTDPAGKDPASMELHLMSESQPGLPAVTTPRATVPVRLPALPVATPAGGTVPNRLFARFIAGISALDDTDFDAGDGPEAFRAVDRAASALTARLTGGLSPIAMTLATMDWAMHLAGAPGKQAELWLKATRKMSRFTSYMLASTFDPALPPCITPLKDDDRFRAPQWQHLPYRFWYQGFLLTQQFWHNATTGVPGVSSTNARRVAFGARQALDMFSPANFPFTNPEVVERTRKTGGLNFIEGARNAAENLARKAMHQPPAGAEAFVPGETVAVTPGEVIYRNHLIELIQYRATTTDVEAEPILIVPAWIMKYYILDLSPDNSLIRYLVDKGHTVFCISWRNVSAADRDIGLNDYLRLGLMAALDAVGKVCPGHKVHAAGYCLGGTLLAIGAAAMAQASDQRLASMTLFAAQTDFSEPGELELFVDESELYFLESMMWDKGFLTAGQMAGAFQMLRSNDLVWSRMVREYMMGERTPLNDLMAWNADPTRMPFRMHSQYLRRLFLKNDLAAGRYEVDGRPVSLLNLRLPLFVVGTERDHVAPWRSVYKIHQLTDTDVTFVLASGGHNAGIVSEPGHRNRSYRLHETRLGELHLGPEEWMEANPRQEGSWWPAWEAWLTENSSAGRYSLPPIGIPGQGVLGPAPGTYVMQR